MKSLLDVVVALVVAAAFAHAESSSPAAGTTLAQNAPGRAVAKPGGGAAQRGSEPNAGEVRPGNRDGNAPSASAGTLFPGPVERRIFGLPVTAAIVGGGVIVALALAGFAIRRGRRAGRTEQRAVETQLARNLVAHRARDPDAAAFAKPLDAGGDVYSVPVDSVTLNNHVAEVDTDPELHAAVNRQVSVARGEFLLDTDGALDGGHHAGKLGEEVVPW